MHDASMFCMLTELASVPLMLLCRHLLDASNKQTQSAGQVYGGCLNKGLNDFIRLQYEYSKGSKHAKKYVVQTYTLRTVSKTSNNHI